MKYCIKCGQKLDEDSKFCSKCGFKIKNEVKTEPTKKELNKEKLLLCIGTLLIIVASIIFAFANWNEMTGILKVLFLLIESMLFLALSLFSKKLDYKMPYKFLWFIGISFLPIILHLIAIDKILGDYLSYDGNGIYVYLSMSFFLCAIVYFVSHVIFKSNFFLYISYSFTYLLIVSILCMFNLDKFEYMVAILNVINLVIFLIHLFIKNENYNKTLNRFISVIVMILSFMTCIYAKSQINYLFASVAYVSIIATIFLLIFKSKNNVLIYIYPYILNTIILFIITSLLGKYNNIILFLSLLSIIMINLIINLKDNKLLRNFSYISMLMFIIIILINYNVSYLTLGICSVIILATFIFIIKIDNEKMQSYISKTLLPFIIYLIIYSFVRKFTNIDSSFIDEIVSVICFTIYIIFKHKNKDKYTKDIFEAFSYTFLIIASFVILANKPTILSFILNEALWIYYFIFSKVSTKNKALSIWILIMLILNFLFLSIRYSIDFYYSLLFVSVITLILDFIEIKLKNTKEVYIYISLVTTTLAVITNFKNIAVFGVGLCILAYAFTYYLYVKKHKNNFVVKFIFTLVGFTLIDSIYNYFLSNYLIINILILITYLIIIISMFLLEVDDDRKVLSYSIVVAHPYLLILDNLPFLKEYSVSFIVFLVIALLLIYFERVFKLKEKDKTIVELILFALIHTITITSMLIFNFVLSAFYIFYGFYKKRESFTVFGTVLLIITLLINIFKIFNNISVTYILLVIGIIMLSYVFYMEAKKKSSKK